MEKFTFIDLFCGLGGFRIAMERLGGKCLMSSEIEPNVRETYKLNFGEYPSGDVMQIASEDIPPHDVLCAGFPCQPFSIAGKRLGFEDTRGTLFFEVARIAKAKRPKAIFLENVAGITNHDGGKTLEVIEATISQMGYTFHHVLMNVKDHGIPQNRNRWYGVAFREDVDATAFAFPESIQPLFKLEDIIEPTASDEYKISDLARLHVLKYREEFKENPRYNTDHILIANEVRASRCAFSCNGIMPCLTAKMGTGGNNVPIVVSEMRQLTERECLTLMGYPTDYKLQQAKSHSYKQIGNSVCVPVVGRIAENIIDVTFVEEVENERGVEKMLNSFNAVGRLVKDIDLRTTSNGIPVVDFAIACDQDLKNKDGEREADFFDCEVWRQSAEYLSKYAGKGDTISISGRMKTERWTDNSGNAHKSFKVVVDKVYVVAKKREVTNQQVQGYNMNNQQGHYTAQGNDVNEQGYIDNHLPDESRLPF